MYKYVMELTLVLFYDFSLRRTVQPNQEQCRRVDNSLKIWIQEAKNIAPKKR